MKLLLFLPLLVYIFIASISAYADTPLYSTKVDRALSDALDANGKWERILVSPGSEAQVRSDLGVASNTNPVFTGTITAGNITTTTSLSLQKHYAQLSSIVNQQPGTTSPVVVTFDQNDQIQGLTHSTVTNTGSITVNKTGVYAIFAGAQIGKESGASTVVSDMWLRVNNVDVANSNVRNSIKQADDTKVLINTSGILLNNGDYVNIMQSVDTLSVGAGMIATVPVGEPVIPSIILTMYEL